MDEWGHLADSESYGRPNKDGYVYEELPFTTAQGKTTYKKGGHALIWSLDEDHKMFGLYPARAQIMMQMRFDGLLGFPGGLIDAGEDIIEGTNRELMEEINLPEKFYVLEKDHVASYCDQEKNLILHFFAKKVSLNDFKEIERGILLSKEFGEEVLGPVRVPLYTMGDGLRGLPMFLCNKFAGNAREELLKVIRQLKLLTDEELQAALKAAYEFSKS